VDSGPSQCQSCQEAGRVRPLAPGAYPSWRF
jgi:hypothetical protein